MSDTSQATQSAALPLVRTRLALALIAGVVVALELSLMRGLAIRYSSHFAGIVISLGLLGFGAAGSMLTLLRGRVMRAQRAALVILALGLAAAIPLTWWTAQLVPLNVNYLAWNLMEEGPHLLLIELLMMLPFALGGAFIGIVLMDAPARINGHYASDLFGSGAGGIAAVMAMNLLSPSQLLVAQSAAALLGALLLLHGRNPGQWLALALAAAASAGAFALMPWQPTVNEYKPLATALRFSDTKLICRTDGPLGRIDVVEGPSLHTAPELSLQYLDDPPPHVELYTDGDALALVYNCKKPGDWEFADYRTAASPFFLHTAPTPPKVCIIGAGGGLEIGTALLHHSADVTALQLNPQVTATMLGPLAARGGDIYRAPGVKIVPQESRGFFASTPDSFDIIQFPPIGGFGAAGSDATQESYAYTIESIRAMFAHLTPTGTLAITRGLGTPPREELRAFDLAVQSLRREGVDPATHLAMIRGGFSCTILIFRQPMQEAQIAALRKFCKRMSFDPCYFPGLTDDEANPVAKTSTRPAKYGSYNRVDQPYYFSGPQALLGTPEERARFLAAYPFDISAPTDNQPYFFHTFLWRSYSQLHEKYGEGSHIFLEVSYVMLLVSLAQATLLAVILILLPMTPGINALRLAQRKTASLGYFLMIGLGFMLLEMAFVQKLVLYLAHPIYAAAVVIASFLVFAGLGSQCSKAWRMAGTPAGLNAIVSRAAVAICVFGIGFLLALDSWLRLTQSWDVAARCLVAAATIAPLAFAMGHLFPLGLMRTADQQPALVPWGWAINGFASVLAAAGAPILAMRFGFSWLVIVAMSCYILAGVIFRFMTPHSSIKKPSA